MPQNVRVPQYTSLKIAISLFYEKTELNNSDIQLLFGKLSSSTIARLKNKARQQMDKDNVPSWNFRMVNTRSAFKAWGLDIDDLEYRYSKCKAID